jgi:hypothetical protein
MSNTAAETNEGESSSPFGHVEAGIYRNTSSGTYFERPKIQGKRTWRSLETKNLKHARETFHKRRSDASNGQGASTEPKITFVGGVIRHYETDGYLDKHLQPRTGGTHDEEGRHCKLPIQFWDKVEASAVSDFLCDKYAEWRKKGIQQGSGERMIDGELTTLNNAFRYAKRRDSVRFNPLVDRPKYQTAKMVKHCREFMPGSADELHGCASELMLNPHSVVLGFQLLFEAMTGLRTCEILKWRTDAGPDAGVCDC